MLALAGNAERYESYWRGMDCDVGLLESAIRELSKLKAYFGSSELNSSEARERGANGQAAMREMGDCATPDLDSRMAAAAVQHLMATRVHMPAIAEVRAAALEMQRGPIKAGGEAWGQVLRAISRFGFYQPPNNPEDERPWSFSDPITGRCVEALGWRSLCSSENLQPDRARFIELYDKLAKEQRTAEVTAALPAVQQAKALRSEGGPKALGDIVKLLPGGKP
jgi:hypothetical protein